MASGYRGGWSNTLTTVNRMTDIKPQLSLTESLRHGAIIAHRSVVHGGNELRNVRRSALQKAKVREA